MVAALEAYQIIRAAQAHQRDLAGPGISRLQAWHQAMRQIFVQQQPHAARTQAVWRSRSAA